MANNDKNINKKISLENEIKILQSQEEWEKERDKIINKDNKNKQKESFTINPEDIKTEKDLL